ncbi:hypothetical protein CMUS01_09243 [Colletotrichum musicola]|uniref:Uncharacterized protein n=1 Tax=Colletotrichum musicola TaxID=2175873 RepID=A0A8H6K9F8_9PEZI|nr:hypothetical protein CMUS01_09243 [Colletotrichum musicola]
MPKDNTGQVLLPVLNVNTTPSPSSKTSHLFFPATTDIVGAKLFTIDFGIRQRSFSTSRKCSPFPPIITALINDEPLPIIATGPHDQPKKLHEASESARQVDLPRALKETYSTYYTQEADKFLRTNEFTGLAGFDLAKPDPSINFHRNESDVGRSIDLSINRELALVLTEGHEQGSLEMDSTSQAYRSTTFPRRAPHEPLEVISIPDWRCRCVLTSPTTGDQTASTLILEYKDRSLIFVDEVNQELQISTTRLMQDANELQQEASLLTRNLVVGLGQSQALRQLMMNSRQYTLPRISEASTLGLKRPCQFTKNFETYMRQITTYGVVEGARYVGLLDYDSLVMFDFRDLVPHMGLSPRERLRKGPGLTVHALVLKDSPEKIRKNIIGAWIRSIKGI